MPDSSRPVVFVCEECKGHRRLERFLGETTDARIRRVGCQKVCQEPAAGLAVDGRLEWFGSLSSRKRLVALALLVADPERVPRTLQKVRAAKRSGRGPR